MTHIDQNISRKIFKSLVLIYFLALAFVVYDRGSIILNSDVRSAKVTECTSKWVKTQRSSNSTTYVDRVAYTPVAETENGEKAKGSLMMPSRSLCSMMIGKDVPVFIHKTNPDKNRINTFVHFWALSSLVFFLGLAFVLSAIAPRLGATFVCFYIIGGITYCAYEVGVLDKYFPDLIGRDMTSAVSVLERCVFASMHEKNINERSKLTYLVCQDQDLEDLSSIVDLVNLEELYLQNNQLVSLEGMQNFTKLKKLSVAGNKKLTSVKGIEHLVSLEEFQANKAALEDLRGIERLSKLRTIGAMMNNITDISPLSNLENLEDVILNYNKISDISPLTNKLKLKELQLYSNDITDISALFTNSEMTLVGISGRGNIPCEQVKKLQNILSTTAKIYGPEECNKTSDKN